MGGLLTTLALPSGYPTTGLVAYFDLMVDNLLLTTAMTLNWNLEFGGTGVVPTRTTGQTDKDGGTTAVRLQMNKGASDTSADYSVFNQVVALPNPHASAGRVWLRSNDASTYNVILRDNAASVASGVLCAVTPTWQSFAYTPQAAVAAASSTFYLGLRGALGCSQTADILVCFPQFVPRVTMPDYVATTDLQSLASLYGKSPTLQRGATSGAEASDGALVATGWQAVTDDYLFGGALTLDPGGVFTIGVTGLFNGTVYSVISLAVAASDLDYQRIVYNGSGQVRIGSRGGGAEVYSSDLAVSTTAQECLVLSSDGTTLTLWNMRTGVAVSAADQNPSGVARLGVGCLARLSVTSTSPADALTISTVDVASVNRSAIERTRAYRAIKARAARKGVVIG